MEIIETSIFSKLLQELKVTDEDYFDLQKLLLLDPERGDMIPGTGGLRKVRMGRQGSGKRGSYRVIYYWRFRADQIYMIFIYSKNRDQDLSPKQKAFFKDLVKELV